MTETASIPFIAPGLLNLGAATPSALKRLANYTTEFLKSGAPIPDSPFCEWAADRVTGDDRQDLVLFLQGRRGSGKSYSCLYLAKRLAEAIARRKSGVWEDYFSLNNCATLEDTERVLALLNTTGKYQIVLIDDCSLAISNRSWNSPQNRNFNALLSVCRTNRWILLLTAPLKAHVDNQTREMCDFTGTLYKSFHKAGFNIIKMTSSDISTSGKEYTHKLHFYGRKVDYWISFKPDPELTKEYDIQRDESARRLNTRIVTTGSFKATQQDMMPKKSIAERNAEAILEKEGEAIRKYMADNPGVSMNKLSSEFGHSYQLMARVVKKVQED